MTISIVIATYDDERWRDLAMSRAYPSAITQAHETVSGREWKQAEVIDVHLGGGTLAEARNTGAAAATQDWLCFLDADDELAPGYVQAMRHAEDEYVRGQGLFPDVLLTPRVQYVRDGRPEAPKFWREIELWRGNWLVIGTLVPRALFHEVGGFGEEPLYEDWAFFARCWKAGARPIKVPDAVYVAHYNEDGRNKGYSAQEQVEAHYEIGRRLFAEEYTEKWLAARLRNAARADARDRRAKVRGR